MERPTWALDVDDVLCGFTPDVLRRLNALTGKSYALSEVSTWDPFDSLGHHELREEIWHSYGEEGACFALPVNPGAQAGVELIRAVADVIIVTHHFKFSKTWVHEREEWLRTHFGVHRDDIYFCKKKYRVHADGIIDDKVQNVREWQSYNYNDQANRDGNGILWATPMNRLAPKTVSRIGDWKEVVRAITGKRKLRGR